MTMCKGDFVLFVSLNMRLLSSAGRHHLVESESIKSIYTGFSDDLMMTLAGVALIRHLIKHIIRLTLYFSVSGFHRMPTSSDKLQSLQAQGCLHPHPERVLDDLFHDHPFFDARDLVQVKYEMLRCVREGDQSVSESSARFGLSRTTYYAAATAFEADGLAGLLPQRTGPRGPHKFSPDLVAALQAERRQHPRPSWEELVVWVEARFGLKVHAHSIQRALSQKKKTP